MAVKTKDQEAEPRKYPATGSWKYMTCRYNAIEFEEHSGMTF